MQNWKKLAGALLALALTTGTLAGCSGGGESSAASSQASAASSQAPASSAASQASSAADAATPADDYDYSEGLTETGCFAGVTALDYVTLPDYEKMELPEGTADVSEEDLQSKLDSMAQVYATTEEVTDRAVEDGDTVNIDYVGSVDGVEFEGGNTQGAGATVTIGVTSYIDDFLEQLIGHEPGETFDVNVTFPDPYENNADLSGKDAVFVTTINYIQETKTPELTDSFVAENWQESRGWTTADQMREGVRTELAQEAAWDYLWEQISGQAEVAQVPEAIQNYHLENMKHYYTSMAQQYGMETEDFLSQYFGVEDMDSLVEQNQSMVDENARKSLLLQALCESMEYTVSQEEMDAYLKEELNTEDYSDLESYYGKPYLFLLARETLVQKKLSAMKVPG